MVALVAVPGTAGMAEMRRGVVSSSALFFFRLNIRHGGQRYSVPWPRRIAGFACAGGTGGETAPDGQPGKPGEPGSAGTQNGPNTDGNVVTDGTPPTATQLVLSPMPGDVVPGITFSYAGSANAEAATDMPATSFISFPYTAYAFAEDASGHLTSFNGNVTVSLGNDPTKAVLNGTGGTVTSTAVDGVAKFSGLAISAAGDGYTLEATAEGSCVRNYERFRRFFRGHCSELTLDAGRERGDGKLQHQCRP